MKAMKNMAGVSPVIAVILMVAITVVLAGVVFLWAQSFTDNAGGEAKILDITTSIMQDTDAVADDDKLEIEVMGGTIIWGDYQVKVDGTVVTTTATQSIAGDTVIFLGNMPVITSGTSYKVQIVDLENNKVVYSDESVVATAYDSIP